MQPTHEKYGLFIFGDKRAPVDYNIELGISLHPPRRTPDMLNFSIVAVHGLGGDWQSTWTDENGKLWLRDFLPSQLPNARIMSYGYNSETVFTQSVEDITDTAMILLERLTSKRQEVEERTRPIMFISHSLGGIVVKKAGPLQDIWP